jgi:hypothetical protein
VAGRRYARIDEIGVPYVVTVDFDSAVDGCVTLRERDTCEQIRVPIRDVVGLVFRLTREAQGNQGPYFSKVLYIAALYTKYTRALTFEDLCNRTRRRVYCRRRRRGRRWCNVGGSQSKVPSVL